MERSDWPEYTYHHLIQYFVAQHKKGKEMKTIKKVETLNSFICTEGMKQIKKCPVLCLLWNLRCTFRIYFEHTKGVLKILENVPLFHKKRQFSFPYLKSNNNIKKSHFTCWQNAWLSFYIIFYYILLFTEIGKYSKKKNTQKK